MDEIKQYFTDFESQLQSHPDITSIQQYQSQRIAPQTEQRQYKIFISDSVEKPYTSFYQQIKQEFPEISKVSIEESYIQIESVYEK